MSLTGNYNDNIKVLDYWLYHMNLEGKIQETCSNKENCPTRQPTHPLYALEGHLVDCQIDLKCQGCQFVHPITAFEGYKYLTARKVHENNQMDSPYLECQSYSKNGTKSGCGHK